MGYCWVEPWNAVNQLNLTLRAGDVAETHLENLIMPSYDNVMNPGYNFTGQFQPTSGRRRRDAGGDAVKAEAMSGNGGAKKKVVTLVSERFYNVV